MTIQGRQAEIALNKSLMSPHWRARCIKAFAYRDLGMSVGQEEELAVIATLEKVALTESEFTDRQSIVHDLRAIAEFLKNSE